MKSIVAHYLVENNEEGREPVHASDGVQKPETEVRRLRIASVALRGWTVPQHVHRKMENGGSHLKIAIQYLSHVRDESVKNRRVSASTCTYKSSTVFYSVLRKMIMINYQTFLPQIFKYEKYTRYQCDTSALQNEKYKKLRENVLYMRGPTASPNTGWWDGERFLLLHVAQQKAQMPNHH